MRDDEGVIGAGAQGSVIARELVNDADVSEVMLFDIDLRRAERLACLHTRLANRYDSMSIRWPGFMIRLGSSIRFIFFRN
jgi:3-hydroxyacyl-CoA dehydrogenase